jgi:tRNA(fMet)-specific endonuclease VapC
VNFLVDTDTCSAHLKEKGIVSGRFLQFTGRLNVSVITVGELYTWALRAKASPQRLPSLLDMLRDMNIVEVSHAVARKFGELRAALMDAGKPTPEMDLLIAATALVHGFAVVTHNVGDFAHVPGLTVADWLVP